MKTCPKHSNNFSIPPFSCIQPDNSLKWDFPEKKCNEVSTFPKKQKKQKKKYMAVQPQEDSSLVLLLQLN